MNKPAIRNYAIWARVQLIEAAKQRAYAYEITEKGPNNPRLEIIGGKPISREVQEQRKQLISEINHKGFDQVMEEAAYIWFNRFIALRFMEVNGYLPTKVRVFTDENGEFKPDILREAMTVELPVDREKVLELLDKQDNEALFKLLIIAQCNALNEGLPVMFESISNWTELLFPSNLLKADSVIGKMVITIPAEDWADQVQIIGWLYQYYNSEPKDKVFENLKKNIKISKENIPAATQLFTPDWIVRYMVENSLGRLWVEGHPNDELKSNWKYYLEEAEQEPEVQAQLAAIRAGYAQLKPEDLLCIDPCMGSGHILCYMFDVLVQIYEAYGYTAREAAVSIVEHNLWGLDIDDRAAQLAYFAVMMKARQYDRRFLTRGIQPHVMAIQESNGMDATLLMGLPAAEQRAARMLIETFHDAKEYGSILTMKDELMAALAELPEDAFAASMYGDDLRVLALQAKALGQKYYAVVTNPPYMGSSGFGTKLADYVKINYPDTKSDMSTVFMEKTLSMCALEGFMSMINIPVWMFITSYEAFRNTIIANNTIINMVHPGRGIFGSDFGSTSFVISKNRINSYKGHYRRLFNTQVEVESPEAREQALLMGKGQHYAVQSNYLRIPGSPIAYWVSSNFIDAFSNGRLLGDCIPVKKGMDTGDNDHYLKLWYEVVFGDVDLFTHAKTWVPYDKGGDFRRWYGNNSYLVNWKNDGYELKHSKANLRSPQLYFRKSITWNALSAGNTCFRYSSYYGTFDSAGSSMFPVESDIPYYLGLMNSKISQHYLNVINPTINYGAGSMAMIPVLSKKDVSIEELSNNSISLSKADWDSYETSWDFQQHPLISTINTPDATSLGAALQFFYGANPPKPSCPLELAYLIWQGQCNKRFLQLKANEEELNRIFIDIYGLQDELTPDVADKDVTVRRADLQRDIKSLISYAVGCMLGRYSLDKPGLNYAGGEWALDEAATYPADRDGILPITDDDYFDDDIVGMFVKFIETVYGKDTLEENLRFIADALGGTGTSREVIRSYFLNDFYKDHCTTYSVTGSGKRPIYWLFDAGKKNSFKCLIYMHRYRKDTIARIRTDYVHEMQSRFRTAIEDIEKRIESAAGSERVRLTKQLTKLKDQDLELRKYEEKIHHLADQMIDIDLDDGVKVNYAKFEDVLAKIK